MSVTSIIILLLLGVVTLSLGVYLGLVLAKLRKQKQSQKSSELRLSELMDERHHNLRESIITISRAAVQDQCELSEACIRVKKLLENYSEIEARSEFEIIQRMFVELEEFSYLEDRKALSKQEKFNQDKKRFMIEDKFRDPMLKALDKLIPVFEAQRK